MKKLITAILAMALAVLPLALTSCGEDSSKIIKVGASPTPHAEILEQARPILEKNGYTLEIVEYDDYVLPNTALDDGELDANYFQHTPYLNSFNANNGTDIVSAALIHYEPFGIYGNGVSKLSELAEGATIIIPNDGSNETRALMLLAQEGLIKLKDGVTAADNLTKLDIKENYGGYDINEVDASLAPAQLKNSDAGSVAVINGNYAIGAGLKIADALAKEDASGEAAKTYANIIAVRKGDEKSEKTLALIEALKDAAIIKYINDSYSGAVLPID